MQNFEPEPDKPSYLRILVCDLTEESAGNATGIGLADFTTKRLVDKFDKKSTYVFKMKPFTFFFFASSIQFYSKAYQIPFAGIVGS